MSIEDNTNCIECGNAFELHSLDRRCPKNGGYQINGKLEFFATHFEPEISETDQLRATIAFITDAQARQALMIYAKDRQIAELTRMLFALGKQDGQTIRELTEKNRGLRQMLHMEPK